ncbi:peptidoglycan editing factor PgeF [Candidatus Falkowbacteria bacterium HGW-Falkowbacteria-1]|jgi:hypothetical protein|uniref:Purine nucleoside phosphorylase n=1 Tax=Candidatus Falkowbacteria bacterium HGW-Falkowbacteria-1 TaxID=2013768 RepID=A0A2N2E8W7_9BACT|nr:MAG: peptidoglycan editing factor PgeF [Candidatus Falkowbacteria bacterium HGW-Falkowbacteria-1]
MSKNTNILKNNKVLLGISTKKDGNLRLLGKDTVIKNNRQCFLKKNALKKENLVSSKLIHGNKIKIISDKDENKNLKGYDGLITNIPKIILSITVADCLPIYFYDSNKNVIGLAHAGWRGLKSSIIKKMIKSFKSEYQSDTKNIKIFIGPHIQKCHFEIRNDLLKKFKEYDSFIIKKKDKIFLDLELIAKQQLLENKILKKNIEISPECTYCLKNKYFSYRRDGDKNFQTMMAYIELK